MANYPTKSQIEGYIRDAARARGINPNTAVAVWSYEGRNANPREAWQSFATKNGRREQSFGPYQLLDKPGAVGWKFQKDTGLKLRDPKTWKAQVDYALNHAAKKGWSAWFGAKKAGVNKWTGLQNAKAVPIGKQAPQFDVANIPTPVAAPRTLAVANAKPPAVERGLLTQAAFSSPVAPGARVTSSFGQRASPGGVGSRNHKGMDIARNRGAIGAPVSSAASGVVSYAGKKGGFGNYVEIDHGNGLKTAYGHLDGISVKTGQEVGRGAVIGQLGSTGRSTNAHLHFEVTKDGQKVNPASVLGADWNTAPTPTQAARAPTVGTPQTQTAMASTDQVDRGFGLGGILAPETAGSFSPVSSAQAAPLSVDIPGKDTMGLLGQAYQDYGASRRAAPETPAPSRDEPGARPSASPSPPGGVLGYGIATPGMMTPEMSPEVQTQYDAQMAAQPNRNAVATNIESMTPEEAIAAAKAEYEAAPTTWHNMAQPTPVAPAPSPVAAPAQPAAQNVADYRSFAPAPPTPSAANFYSGQSNYGLANNGVQLGRDALGRTVMTSPSGHQTVEIDGRHAAVWGEPLSAPPSLSKINVSMPSLPSRERVGKMGKTAAGIGAGGLLGGMLAGPLGGLLGAALGKSLAQGKGLGGIFGNSWDANMNKSPGRTYTMNDFPAAPRGGSSFGGYSQSDISRGEALGGSRLGDAMREGKAGLW